MKSKSFLDAMNDVDPEIVRSAEPGRRRKTLRIVLLAAAAVLLLTMILVPVGLAIRDRTPEAPAAETTAPAEEKAAVVYLDVNPSFTLDVTKDGKILAVAAANDDAKKVLAENEDLTGNDVTVGDLLGVMMEDGYLSGKRDTLLLSVKCTDEALAEELKPAAFYRSICPADRHWRRACRITNTPTPLRKNIIFQGARRNSSSG